MAGDDKRTSGQRIKQVRATTWNAMVAAGEAHEKNLLGVPGPVARPVRQTNLLKAQNDTGQQRKLGEVVGLRERIITDVDAEHIWLSADQPFAEQPFGILRYHVPAGEITDVQTSGICIALVDIKDRNHTHAIIIDEEYTLQSAPEGPIRIIEAPNDNDDKRKKGIQECVVRIGRANYQYVVSVPKCGIPGRTQLPTGLWKTGEAKCKLYRIDEDGTLLEIKDELDKPLKVVVRNHAGKIAGPGTSDGDPVFLNVIHDHMHSWIAFPYLADGSDASCVESDSFPSESFSASASASEDSFSYGSSVSSASRSKSDDSSSVSSKSDSSVSSESESSKSSQLSSESSKSESSKSESSTSESSVSESSASRSESGSESGSESDASSPGSSVVSSASGSASDSASVSGSASDSESASDPSGSDPSGSGPSGSASGGSGSGPSYNSETSGSDKSTAIVPASWSPTGFTALHVLEAPEVRFDDMMTVTTSASRCIVPIDPKFVEVCHAGTIQVCGAVPDFPVAVGASVIDGNQLRIVLDRMPYEPITIAVRITGIRRGHFGTRFPDRTREQYEANERFIRSAYPASERTK